MKTNAPERIWIDLATDLPKLSGHINKDSIEYTNTDAFIKKAKKWFEKRNEWFDLDGNRHCDMESFEDFVNYIKKSKVMEWISTKIRFPKAGEQVLTACKNKNMEDGIWLYDLCYYYPNSGWENRENWEDVLYWTYIDKPKQK